MDLKVFSNRDGTWVDWGAGRRRCAVGPGGIGEKSREGDGITPLGAFAVREVFYRTDRLAKPDTLLPLRIMARDDGWCDAPGDPGYNKLVKLPYPASAEHLWRDDNVYDLVAVLGFNDDPVVSGKGSAIFLHIARPDYSPTAGCVALRRDDALAGLAQLRPGERVVIG